MHRKIFTHKPFYTQTLLTQALLHTDPFTHKAFHKQTLDIKTFSYRGTCTQSTQIISYRETRPVTSQSYDIKIAILPQFLISNIHFVQKDCDTPRKIAFLPQLLTPNDHFVRKGHDGPNKIGVLPEFLMSNIHLARSCDGYFKIVIDYNQPRKIATSPDVQHPFRTKGLLLAKGQVKSQFCLNFWRITPTNLGHSISTLCGRLPKNEVKL